MSQKEKTTIGELEKLVVTFARERGWTNAPKNLAMSVAIESAEIMEHYQWKDVAEPLTPQERDELALECADVLWYLLRLCAAEGIDPAEALKRKWQINETRWPVREAGA